MEMGSELGLEAGHEKILGGSVSVKGMDSYAQRYGGHQFGHWAGQLGDGRAITLGEVKTASDVLELQLKGAGATPYSRTADGKQCCVHPSENFFAVKLCTIWVFRPPEPCRW